MITRAYQLRIFGTNQVIGTLCPEKVESNLHQQLAQVILSGIKDFHLENIEFDPLDFNSLGKCDRFTFKVYAWGVGVSMDLEIEILPIT